MNVLSGRIHCILIVVLSAMTPRLSEARFSVSLDGDTVRIWDANFGCGCAARFFLLIRQSNDTLHLIECDTALHAPCKCTYSLCTSLSGLVPGTYVATVARELRSYFRRTPPQACK
jgi:hypothetical protein